MNTKRAPNRIQQKQASEYYHQPSNDPQLRTALKSLLDVVKSSYGPSGKLKTLQNNVGGHVTVTSTSGRLFPLLTVSKAVLKLITTATLGHLQAFSDGGLFTALFCIELVTASKELDIHPRLLTEVYEYVLDVCVEYISDENAVCSLKIDFGKVDVLIDVVRSVFRAKAGCFLFGKNLQHVCHLVVELFLETLSNCGTFPEVHYLCVEGSNPLSSHVVPGILFQQLSKQNIKSARRTILPSGESSFKCALFNISLSGDSQEFLDANYEMYNTDFHVDDVVINKIMQICENLVKENVGVVMCQKVIHPRVKRYLQEHNVIILDRLGLQHTASLLKLTGAVCLSSITVQPSPENIGFITGMDYMDIGQKTFIHLQNSAHQMNTVVLCNRHEECLEEMKVTFKAALQNLQLLMMRPAVLYGGGCWETYLASYVRQKVLQSVDQLAEKLECSKRQVLTASSSFAHCLEKVAMATHPNTGEIHQVDRQHWHHWTENSSTCGCGQLVRTEGMTFEDLWTSGLSVEGYAYDSNDSMNNRRELVFDSLPARLNALQVAVNTANVILGISNLIISRD